MNNTYRMGLDIGSTTVKTILLDDQSNVKYSTYERHFSSIRETLINILNKISNEIGNISVKASVTGSGGMMVSKWLNIPFVQEVVAGTIAVEKEIPKTDCAIELGGEDAKITFFGNATEQRMNGTCAGGTGAFIDQMATLLKTDAMGLNEMAKSHTIIYPIASRCGVFSKTDIQPLINDGAKKADIAASIFQAVVNQTISGLACGHSIKGNIAFLGGPLFFLSELRKRFIETLNLSDDEIIFPDNSNLFVAIGAAYESDKSTSRSFKDIIDCAQKNVDYIGEEIPRLNPLFNNIDELHAFNKRHQISIVKRKNISEHIGPCFLGLDVGSTTTKAIIIDNEKKVLYTHYSSNEGTPLEKVLTILKDIYSKLPSSSYIGKACVTGYGEGLIKSALKVDLGEIETIAHYKGAKHFKPEVDFILDIGGQDMKCIKIRNGTIDSIILNEACSSGCGSFLETFSKSLSLPINEFVVKALSSKNPVDLGTRCTVFMNSRVKQAQKEGADVCDISAGLCYSVIKNALQKVIKIHNVDELGENIIVQGGTFYNDAVLRVFELISKKNVIRPDISGLMGAFGASIIAFQNYKIGDSSSIVNKEGLETFKMGTKSKRCKGCTNNCLLTIHRFTDASVHITGNRCEIGAGETKNKDNVPNLFQYKYKKIFDYEPLPIKIAPRGRIGIPRVLNQYENYPFWFIFFTELGYRVELSSDSSRDVYEKGIDSIPSESVCYPAKLVHGHIRDLIDKGIKTIFYPCIPYEKKEFKNVNNWYNCPIVMSYPETIKHNMDIIENSHVQFINPFLALDDQERLKERLIEIFEKEKIPKKEIKIAIKKATKEIEHFRNDVREKGEETILWLKENNKKGIVLAGRPYHVDPEVSHGLDNIITGLGMAVLTEDSIAHLAKKDSGKSYRVLDQWKYHSRLYKAAEVVNANSMLELIQLTSFGCGLDAVTSEQTQEILEEKHKIYSLIKIDEVSNLGAIKIRIRSLIAAMEERDEEPSVTFTKSDLKKAVFTKKMKKTHTLLAPQMSPIHFDFIADAMKPSGYKVEVLPSNSTSVVDEGLIYVNNDACYPAIITTGQIMDALKSGKYDLNKVSVLMTQTGGPCRASNYVAFIRKALKDANMEQIPVISLNMAGLESNPGFKLSLPLINRVLISLIYGDLFQRVIYATKPYEKIEGTTINLYKEWRGIVKQNIKNPSFSEYKRNIHNIVKDFDSLARVDRTIPKVGIVGEILVKYHPDANNNLIEILESEGAEVVVPDLMDFFLYCSYNPVFKKEELSGSTKEKNFGLLAIKIIEKYRKQMRFALRNSVHFEEPSTIFKKAQKAKELISLGNQGGEGWFLTAEMMELIEDGIENIVCVQPFACLPNHVMGKGMIKPIRKKYPKANIAPIDYDPGASEVNQINRIKLMMATAHKNLEKKQKRRL